MVQEFFDRVRSFSSLAVVLSQRLLVLGRAEDGNIASFIQLVHGVLKGRLGSLFIVRPEPWRSIVKVGREDSLGTIDHEEWCVAGVLARGRPQASEHHGKLYDPSSAKLAQPVEILGLRPYRTMLFVCSTCPFVRGCATAAQSTRMWYSS